MSSTEDEINMLVNAAHQAAEKMLKDLKVFDPFALILEPSGSVSITNAILDPEHGNTIEQKVEYLRYVLRQMAERNEVKGTALIGMMQIRLVRKDDYTDAFAFEVEHQEGWAFNFYVPYTWQGDSLTQSDPIIKQTETVIFRRQDHPDNGNRSGSTEKRQKKQWWRFGR